MLENTEGAIKNGQSRENGNTIHKKNTNKTKRQHNMCQTPPHKNNANKTTQYVSDTPT
jgi:hypothetical protein